MGMEIGRDHYASRPLGLLLGWLSPVGAPRDQTAETRADLPVDLLCKLDVDGNAFV